MNLIFFVTKEKTKIIFPN